MRLLVHKNIIENKKKRTMSEEVMTSRAIVLNFMDMMKQFLSALREVYPECSKVVGYDVAFTLKTSGKTIEQMETLGIEAMEEYHKVMEPYYARCTRRDESLIRENIEFLDALDLPRKWNSDMHPETKDAIWEFIIQLNNFCCLNSWTRNIVPAPLMSVITSNATEMANKIKSGEMKMSDFNVMQLSQQIMESVDARDLEALGASLQAGNGFDIGSMYTMLTSMMSATESSESHDIGSLLRSMIPSFEK